MHTTIAITMGDINGIGPEVIAKAFAHGRPVANAVPIVLGCARAYQDARSVVPGAARPVVVPDVRDAAEITDGLPFLQGEVAAPRRAPGQLDPEAGRAAMAWLARAVDLALEGAVGGIVTCPIHKEGIHRAGYACRGHTDFIANRTGARSYRMALYVRGVLVVHLTDHVPLRAALESVRADRIVETIHIAEAALRGLGGRHRIAVAGLNPHAGEASAFGSEERDEIAPAVERSRVAGLDCSGPHSPDAVFRQALEGRYDAVVAMYHDQGHIPMKLVAMDEGVNVTLGIPIVRTSVDHGTAYDIAGTGTAREQSFLEAYRLAARMATRTSKVGS